MIMRTHQNTPKLSTVVLGNRVFTKHSFILGSASSPPGRPPTQMCVSACTYCYSCLIEEVMHSLRDISGMHQVVVRIFVLAVPHFQGLHKWDKRRNGDLKEKRKLHSLKGRLTLREILRSPLCSFGGSCRSHEEQKCLAVNKIPCENVRCFESLRPGPWLKNSQSYKLVLFPVQATKLYRFISKTFCLKCKPVVFDVHIGNPIHYQWLLKLCISSYFICF